MTEQANRSDRNPRGGTGVGGIVLVCIPCCTVSEARMLLKQGLETESNDKLAEHKLAVRHLVRIGLTHTIA